MPVGVFHLRIVESQIFWFVATVTCLLAFGFAFLQRRSISREAGPDSVGVARGQEKDNWLTCAVVWGVILGTDAEFAREFELVGSVVLGLIAWRTSKRVALLHRSSADAG